MTSLKKKSRKGRIEHFDASWGGYRSIDTYNDASDAILSASAAHREALALSKSAPSREYRVVEEATESVAERITRYRYGRKLG